MEYFKATCLPSGFQLNEPSHMGMSVKILLNHLRLRQEEFSVKVFTFHHIIRNGKKQSAEYPSGSTMGDADHPTVDVSTAQGANLKLNKKEKSPSKKWLSNAEKCHTLQGAHTNPMGMGACLVRSLNMGNLEASPPMSAPNANSLSSTESTTNPNITQRSFGNLTTPEPNHQLGCISETTMPELHSKVASSGYHFGDMVFPPETHPPLLLEVKPSIMKSPLMALSGNATTSTGQNQMGKVVNPPNVHPPALFGQTLPQSSPPPQMSSNPARHIGDWTSHADCGLSKSNLCKWTSSSPKGTA
jgi:hypothetical protein